MSVKQSITQESEKSRRLNEALEKLRGVYEPDVESLVYLAYRLGGTQEEIANALNTPREVVSKKYPKKKMRRNHVK